MVGRVPGSVGVGVTTPGHFHTPTSRRRACTWRRSIGDTPTEFRLGRLTPGPRPGVHRLGRPARGHAPGFIEGVD